MAIKKDLVKDRIDQLEGKQGIKKSRHHEVKKSLEKEPERYQKIREAVGRGEATNYYINKKGELMQRILIHLPIELVDKLDEEKKGSFPNKSISDLIRNRLKS